MQLKVYNTVFYSRLYYVELIMGYRKFHLHQRKNAERKRLVSRQLKSVQGRPKRRQRGGALSDAGNSLCVLWYRKLSNVIALGTGTFSRADSIGNS